MSVRPASLPLLTLLLASPQFAQKPEPQGASHTLTQRERDYAMSQMHATRKIFLDSVAGLTPEQWSFKPAPNRWSIAECAEHIAVSEDFISGLVREKIMKMPAAPEKRAELKVTDEQVTQTLPDRSQKFQAPEDIAPKKRWPQPGDAVAHFKGSRDHNIAYIESTQDDLRDHLFAHPAMGLLDAYQWLLLLSGHTERHTLQILEVKADPKYPR